MTLMMSLSDISRMDKIYELYVFLGHVIPMSKRKSLFQNPLETADGKKFDKMNQFLLQKIRDKY